MNKLVEIWKTAAEDLGLDIHEGFILKLPSGVQINAEVLVKNFGAHKGMLIISRSKEVWDFRNELTDQGFGFSVMSIPGENEVYDRDGKINVLSDWGWSGPPEEKPTWIKDELGLE